MPASALLFRPRLLLLVCALAACGSSAAPRIAPLTIAITPASVTLHPGDSTILLARASGGEAIRLMIEWSIDEGSSGGRLEVLDERGNSEASARYTAPLDANGTYHVSVQLHGFPDVRASTAITIEPAAAADRKEP